MASSDYQPLLSSNSSGEGSGAQPSNGGKCVAFDFKGWARWLGYLNALGMIITPIVLFSLAGVVPAVSFRPEEVEWNQSAT